MYIHTKYSYSFLMLILLMTQMYGQQVRLSRPMIAVKKQQATYTIMLNGKELPVSIFNDIIRIDIHERLNSSAGFVITINNQNDKKRWFKDRKNNPFNHGDKIEIFLIRDKNEPSSRLVKGSVTSINAYDNKPDSSFIVIQGTAPKPDITHQAVIKPTIYKIDSSNRNQFTLEKKSGKDLVKVSWNNVNGTIGLPNFRTGQTVQLNGMGATFNGVYYISEVTHTISSSGYRQHFELSRNDDE